MTPDNGRAPGANPRLGSAEQLLEEDHSSGSGKRHGPRVALGDLRARRLVHPLPVTGPAKAQALRDLWEMVGRDSWATCEHLVGLGWSKDGAAEAVCEDLAHYYASKVTEAVELGANTWRAVQ